MVLRKVTREFKDKIISTYTFGNAKTIKMKAPVIIEGRQKRLDKKTGEVTEYTRQDRKNNVVNSISRTKRALKDLAEANDWEYFATLTFDNEKVDRYNDEDVLNAFKRWRRALMEKYPTMRYVAIPERHSPEWIPEINEQLYEYGAIHFHLLIGGISAEALKLVDSGKRVKYGVTAGQKIYNITGFKYGFTTATKVKDTKRCCSYVLKYMQKEIAQSGIFKKRYYFSKTTCNKPVLKSEIIDGKVEITDKILEKVKNHITKHEKIITHIERQNYIATEQLRTFNLLGEELSQDYYERKESKLKLLREKFIKSAYDEFLEVLQE